MGVPQGCLLPGFLRSTPQGDGPSRLWPAGILRAHGPQWGRKDCGVPGLISPAQPPPWPGVHSLSEKLPPLLPYQRAVLQGDRLHGAIGDCGVERKEAGCLEGTTQAPTTSSTGPVLTLKPKSVTAEPPAERAWSLPLPLPSSSLVSLGHSPDRPRTVFRLCPAISPHRKRAGL